MKKLFTMLGVLLCGTMAYAQSEVITIEDVNMKPGTSETLYVKINEPTKYTAFQLDLKLPKGVKVDGVGMGGAGSEASTRELKNACIDEANNTYRFLAYDMENTKLGENTSLKITLNAAEDAESGTASGTGILFVDPEGESTTQETASANVNVLGNVEVEIPWGGKTSFVCDKDLDFSSLEDVKAYIVTGYDVTGGFIWLTRVKDVPANTPIWIAGPVGEKDAAATKVKIPTGVSITYYPQNLLIGSATESIDIPAQTEDFLNYTIGKDGSIAPRPDGVKGFPAGKAYLHFAKKLSSIVGSAQSVNLVAKGNKLAYVSPCDLDFTNVEGLKAYVVTGYDKEGNMWLTRVMTVSANTPLYLKGEKDSYADIPSVAAQMQLVNMLKGDATNTSALVADDGVFTTCVLSKADGVFNPVGKDVAAFPAGTSSLPLPNSHFKAAKSRGDLEEQVINFKEAEVIKISLGGDATAISRIAVEADGDGNWYNLSGQRISTPTKKGLYIKGGKKVIVK